MSDLKQQILDASVAIIAKEGVRALSFREVARQGNVSHQAPYHYFKNHHEILRAIASEGFAKLTIDMEQAVARDASDALGALIAAGAAYVKFAERNVGHFRVMFQSSLTSPGGPRERLPEGDRAYDLLVKLADAARKAGAGEGLDTETLAALCWATVHGIATLRTEGAIENDVPKPRSKVNSAVVIALGHLLRKR